jgi:hypothetical protein
MSRDGPRPPLCGASRLGDCVAGLAVYESTLWPACKPSEAADIEPVDRFWSWRIGATQGPRYDTADGAMTGFREYIATMVEEMEMRATAAQEQVEGRSS